MRCNTCLDVRSCGYCRLSTSVALVEEDWKQGAFLSLSLSLTHSHPHSNERLQPAQVKDWDRRYVEDSGRGL